MSERLFYLLERFLKFEEELTEHIAKTSIDENELEILIVELEDFLLKKRQKQNERQIGRTLS